MQTDSTTLPLQFTPNALTELKRILAEETIDGQRYLRIGVKGGGCSGLSYVLGFDEKKDNDEVYDVEGLTCVISPAHAMYLFGMEVDWKNGLDARGFVFNNPNASSTCGCGSSFSV